MPTPLFKGPGTGDTQWQEDFVLTENDQRTPLFKIELETGNVTASGDVVVEGDLTVSGSLDGTASEATTAQGLKSATTTVNVSSATAPTSGQVLTATSGVAATWQTPATPNPISDSTNALESATTTVDVSSSAAPTNGQVLVASGPTAASWQTIANAIVTTGTYTAQTSISVTGLLDDSDYQLTFIGTHNTSSGDHYFRINSDVGSNYDWSGYRFASDGTQGVYNTSSGSPSNVVLDNTAVFAGKSFQHVFRISSVSGQTLIQGSSVYKHGSAITKTERSLTEIYYSASTLSSVQLLVISGTLTGRWTLVKL
jgi:hypothetical protein